MISGFSRRVVVGAIPKSHVVLIALAPIPDRGVRYR